MNKFRSLELQGKTNNKKEKYKYFVGTTLKNPLEYKIGEKMIFKIRVKHMDDYLDIPYVWYSLISDDGQNKEAYLEKSEDGWFYIEASMSKSGFVYVNVRACDENKNIIEGIEEFNGSAGADVGNILRATKTPDDYNEFWDKLMKQVEETEPEILFQEEIKDENYPDYKMYEMRIKAPGSEYVSASVAYPLNAEKGSLKFVMFFQGYGVRSTFPRPLENYFTVFVNAHCVPNGESAEFYANIRDNILIGYGYDAEENKKAETTYWTKMLLRNFQALRFFKDHELLNKKDYYFVGSSQGGMQACNMAAHFDKSTAVIMNVPWMCDVHNHEECGRRENTMPKGVGVTYFDTAVAAQFLKCPAYIISGLGDGVCHSSTHMALFNSINSPKYIEFYQNKVHSFTIPWDNNMYTLGDLNLSDKFREHTTVYYDWA